MKKFYLILISICSLTSCSDTDDASPAEPNPNLLQRVDFYPGTVNELRWLFNEDGLLEKITKADGTIVQDFTYDGNNRLVSSTLFNNGGANTTYAFTYDSNGFVTAVNNQNLQYDSTSGNYYFGDLNTAFTEFKINSDKLLTYSKTANIEEVEVGQFEETVWYDVNISYTNNNILGYFPGESCNYLTYDNKTNPLKNATLAICRAFGFVSESRWPFDYSISANNVLTHKYCLEDPESEVYHYTYNSNNLPEEQTHDSYYLGVYESTMVSAKYYYQGDVLP